MKNILKIVFFQHKFKCIIGHLLPIPSKKNTVKKNEREEKFHFRQFLVSRPQKSKYYIDKKLLK